MKAVPRHVIQDEDKLETIQLGPVSIHVPQIDCINNDLFNINNIKLYNDCKLLNISIPTIKEQSLPIIAAKRGRFFVSPLTTKAHQLSLLQQLLIT